MRNHQNGRKKLNMKSSHRCAVLRNQMIHLVKYGFLQTTVARAKEVQRHIEKIVTIARKGYCYATMRLVLKELPYDKMAAVRLVRDIAPQYVARNGGYTRRILLGTRPSDTAPIARIEWVA